MKNLTIALSPELIERARVFVEGRGLSLNAYIAEILEEALGGHASDVATAKELVEISKKISGNSAGRKWSRDELYHR